MSAFNNLLSGFLKDAVDNIASTVKDKMEDVIEDVLHPDEDRLFMHRTIVTPNDTFKSYNLYSRIENTLLQLIIPEENADTYAADIVKALQGAGY